MRVIEDATTSHTAAGTNAVATVTLAAIEDKKRQIYSVTWSYSAAPTGGRIYVNFGSDTVFDVDVTAGGPGHLANLRLVAPKNTAVTVNLAAGGAGIDGNINVVEIAADLVASLP